MPIAANGNCALGLYIIIIIPFIWRLRTKAPLTHMSLRHMIRSFSQATSEDRHIGDATAWKLSTFTFRQPTRWEGLTNSKSTSLYQSTIPHSTKVDLFYFVQVNYTWNNLSVNNCWKSYLFHAQSRCYGFTPSAIMWIKRYLSNRTQRVFFNENLSNIIQLESGIPQCSCLGPLLFSIFTNDMLLTE